jgi:hypothetical protein
MNPTRPFQRTLFYRQGHSCPGGLAVALATANFF